MKIGSRTLTDRRWLQGALAALLLAAAIPGGVSAQEGETDKLALVGGMLLDGYEAPPIHHAAVVIEGDRIVAAGPESEVEIPADARVIDTRGKTMLPGLIDLHVHLMIIGHGHYPDWWPIFEDRMQEVMAISAGQLLDAGVTTAADMGAPLEILEVRDRIAAGELPGPRMLVSGPWITRQPEGSAITGGLPDYFQYAISDPQEAAARAGDLVEAGVDLIKTWAGMRESDIRAVAEVAHEAGIQVHSHLYAPEAIWGAIRGGTDVLQHVGSAGEPLYSDSLINAIVTRDLPVVPTVAHRIWIVPQTIAFPERLEDPRLREDFPSDLYEAVQESFADGFHRLPYYHTTPRQIRYAKKGAASQFIEANAVIALGTDSGTPANFHTEAAWREIEAMVESGMSVRWAISASTKVAAEVLGRGDDLGTVEPGKLADVIVVDGNPLADVRALGRVERVVKGGVVYK